jgi:hypothetical protein
VAVAELDATASVLGDVLGMGDDDHCGALLGG